ncbi:MAG: hypothetical protein ACREAZ_10555 [Nitrososphaera sp.]
MLERFAYARPLAIQSGNVLCEVFHRSWYVAAAHAVAAVNMVPTLAVIG